jgi:NADPH:quinone reductase-like Zn-dependent oxidoreductase
VDSEPKLDMMRSIGADHVVDYTREDFTRSGERYDLILDLVARRSIFDLKRALSRNGVYVLAGGSMGQIFQTLILGSLISMTGSKKMGMLAVEQNRREDLIYIGNLIETGKIRVVIDKQYPLGDVQEALRYLGDGHALGKVVITM